MIPPRILRLLFSLENLVNIFADEIASFERATAVGPLNKFTKSFASLSPNEVTALTSLITLIFLSPADASTIVNSSFSSAGAAPPAAGAAATAAAAVTPHFSSNCF